MPEVLPLTSCHEYFVSIDELPPKVQPRPEEYLEPSRTSTVELLSGNSYQLLAVNYIHKKTPSQMVDWVLNAPLQIHFFSVLVGTCNFISYYLIIKGSLQFENKLTKNIYHNLSFQNGHGHFLKSINRYHHNYF